MSREPTCQGVRYLIWSFDFSSSTCKDKFTLFLLVVRLHLSNCTSLFPAIYPKSLKIQPTRLTKVVQNIQGKGRGTPLWEMAAHLLGSL